MEINLASVISLSLNNPLYICTHIEITKQGEMEAIAEYRMFW